MSWIHSIKWDKDGLVPVIAQDYRTNKVLMFAWMNQEALELTQKNKKAFYWSRSRKKIWEKGEESGHLQNVHEIRLDCDGDVILLKIEQIENIACHTGRETCFYQKLDDKGMWVTDYPVMKEPKDIYKKYKSYTASLYRDGLEAILKKVNEEAFETIIAARQGDNKELVHEVADLWFHTLVLMAHKNLSAEDILNELSRREGTSGIEEKESRAWKAK